MGNLNPYIYDNPVNLIAPNGKQTASKAHNGGGYRGIGVPIPMFEHHGTYLPFPVYTQEEFREGFDKLKDGTKAAAVLGFNITAVSTSSLWVPLIDKYNDLNKRSNRVLNSDNSEKRIFEPSPKHDATNNGRANKEPINPQSSLDDSYQLSPNTERRVGYDPKVNEFNIFDQTHPGKNVYHGHSREWNELSQQQKNVLIKNEVVNSKGKPLPPKKN